MVFFNNNNSHQLWNLLKKKIEQLRKEVDNEKELLNKVFVKHHSFNFQEFEIEFTDMLLSVIYSVL
jgi:hypothetical protein